MHSSASKHAKTSTLNMTRYLGTTALTPNEKPACEHGKTHPAPFPWSRWPGHATACLPFWQARLARELEQSACRLSTSRCFPKRYQMISRNCVFYLCSTSPSFSQKVAQNLQFQVINHYISTSPSSPNFR